MKILFGVYGKSSVRYKALIQKFVGCCDFSNDIFSITNTNDVPVIFPAYVRDNEKHLFMNGVFIMRDVTLNEFVLDPSAHMTKLLTYDSREIPEKITNGAFNGVVLEKNQLLLFNDFMALAPLYYTFEKDTFIFSTSLQLLQRILNRPWNTDAIREYLALGYHFSYQSMFSGIDCLPPASFLCLKNGKLTLNNYAAFSSDPEVMSSKQMVIKSVHGEFVKAINRIYSPRLKYSLSLTGGMDSRLIYFEWPNRNELLTETAGINSSDFIKARALAEKLGNPSLHALEDLKDDQYTDGIDKFYQACDNPTKLLAEYNYFHLIWKKSRGADFHLSGVGGELLNGESLYLTRKPLHVLREAFLPYSYVEINQSAKKTLIENVLYSEYKSSILDLLDYDYRGETNDYSSRIVDKLDSFLGKPLFMQTYIERFRTFILANASFYPLNIVANGGDFLIMPYNDRDLIETVSRFHPRTRELRRLQLALIRKYDLAVDIPLDTSHLRQNWPYFTHKTMRTVRMVFNIGLHIKVPLIQKGEPPKFRAFKYFDHSAVDFRDHIRKIILHAPFFDKKKLEIYLNEIDKVERFNFYTHHREAGNLMIMFRLAMLEKNLKGQFFNGNLTTK